MALVLRNKFLKLQMTRKSLEPPNAGAIEIEKAEEITKAQIIEMIKEKETPQE